MSFIAGLVVGCAAAVAVGLLARQAWRGGRTGGPDLTTGLAAVALVLALVALVRTGRDTTAPAGDASGEPSPTSSPAAAPSPTPSTTPVTTVRATVEVPNLIGLPQGVAVSKVRGLGLDTDVETLGLANTPPGYVVSQTPLPASRLAPGSTVVLVVSSAT